MNKKILVVLGIVFLAVISISSVSAFWPFDSGNDITVNGVDLHIPEGFESSQLVGSNTKDADYALMSDDGKQALAFIHIRVSDNISPSSPLAQDLSMAYEVINGKECYIESSSDPVLCAYYYSNDKAVQLNVPLSYEYNNKVYTYKDTLNEMIK